MQEGIAHICLITSNMTIVRVKIDQVIPRKRKGNVSQHEKVIYIYIYIKLVFKLMLNITNKIFILYEFFRV